MLRDSDAGLPRVSISHRGVDRLRTGHVWVYRSDVVQAENVQPGSVVLVQEHTGARGKPTLEKTGRPTRSRILGTAFYSSASEIALRMISTKPVEDVHQLVRERIRVAVSYRERFVHDTNSYRVIFSEGDSLPGLIVDRYNDVLSIQVLTQTMDSPSMREILIDELKLDLQPRVIVERTDARVRKLEQLPEKESGLIWENTTGETPVSPTSSSHPMDNESAPCGGNEYVGLDVPTRAEEVG